MRRNEVHSKSFFLARAMRTAVLTCLCATAVIIGFDSATLADYADGYRTEQALTLPDAVRVWRRDAWQRDDFYAEVRLGDLYSQNQSFTPKESSKNPSFFDPVEAYVWYFLALRPDHQYSFDDNANAYQSLYTTRDNAQRNLQQVYYMLTFEQQLEARARIIYILASRGAEGFMVLGRLHGVGIAQSVQPYQPYVPPYQKIQLCMRSDYTYWPLSWLYWVYASVAGSDYPHPPVWKWVDNTTQNQAEAFPDYNCSWEERPPPPSDLTSSSGSAYSTTSSYTGSSYTGSSYTGSPGGSYGGSYSNSAPVPLTSGAGGPSIAPPTISLTPDPRASLQGSPGMNSQTVPLTPQEQTVATSPAAGAYPGYSGAGYGGYAGGYGGYGGYSAGYSGYGSGVPSVFQQNDAEALTYFQRADMLGQPLADTYTAALRNSIMSYNSDGKRIIAEAEKRARYWAPPYEFYPGVTAGGMPHSDESILSLEQRIALGRIGEIPCCAIQEALNFRRYTVDGHGCGPPPICLRRSIVAYQNAIGAEATGLLTPLETVRLIQMAAVDGDAVAQDRLGIMYAKGIGVPQNFVRAEKWFINAANQHDADALFNLYVLYKVGPNGIDPDEHKAASYYLQAMAARYNVLLCELQDLLKQVDTRHDHPDGPRRR